MLGKYTHTVHVLSIMLLQKSNVQVPTGSRKWNLDPWVGSMESRTHAQVRTAGSSYIDGSSETTGSLYSRRLSWKV